MDRKHRNGNVQRPSRAKEVKPHRWALRGWAVGYRRLARPWFVTRHARRFCRPLMVEGREWFVGLRTPALIIANHSGHFDTIIVLSILPSALYERLAVAAAADRFYRRRLKGMWFSLRYNAFPISRGGGVAALAYSEELLRRGWSLLIFPEGTRTRTGELGPFHPGPAILALRHGLTVLPIHIQGSAGIIPVGERRARPAPVRLRVGEPLTFAAGTEVGEATARMETAVRALVSASSQVEREVVAVGRG